MLESIINLMAEPRPEDPLEPEIADQFVNDNGAYFEQAQKHTSENAS